MTTTSLDLPSARQARDGLATLLRREHVAMAEFLVALADFDRRRGWEVLGHSSLFAFLHVELKLPNPSAFWRMSAARLLQRFPDLVAPLREGRLCCSATAELAKVLTEENRAEMLPRFFGLSAREAQEIVAELQPRPAPATRTVVTGAARLAVAPQFALAEAHTPAVAPQFALAGAHTPAEAPGIGLHPDVVPPTQLRTSEVDFGGAARAAVPRDDVEPLTADLRRLHVTVNRQFLKKVDAARDGLSHSIPGATTGQVLEAALDLLLEKQAKARGQVKRPRTALPAALPATHPATPASTPASMPASTPASMPASTPASTPASALPPTLPAAPRASETASAPGESQQKGPPPALIPTEPPPHRRAGPRETIPAAVRRAVWERDQGRCSWPLDGGGSCGSTHRLELDHVVPWARFSEPTVNNLRVVCHQHNALAARHAFGERCVARYSVRSSERGG